MIGKLISPTVGVKFPACTVHLFIKDTDDPAAVFFAGHPWLLCGPGFSILHKVSHEDQSTRYRAPGSQRRPRTLVGSPRRRLAIA